MHQKCVTFCFVLFFEGGRGREGREEVFHALVMAFSATAKKSCTNNS